MCVYEARPGKSTSRFHKIMSLITVTHVFSCHKLLKQVHWKLRLLISLTMHFGFNSTITDVCSLSVCHNLSIFLSVPMLKTYAWYQDNLPTKSFKPVDSFLIACNSTDTNTESNLAHRVVVLSHSNKLFGNFSSSQLRPSPFRRANTFHWVFWKWVCTGADDIPFRFCRSLGNEEVPVCERG